VLSLPIAPGKIEAWRRFCQELSGSRHLQHEKSRQRLGITRERLALVESPFGSDSVMTLEARNPVLALAEIIGSDLPFESWYRERLQDVHRINLARYEEFVRPAADNAQELLFEWKLAARSLEMK
jgi:hypothetical protein